MPPLQRDTRNGLPSKKSGADAEPERGTPPTGSQSHSNIQSPGSSLPPQNARGSIHSVGRKPPGPSPQQIMRARYKQQMMPPRTWKQQEERRKQLEAASIQRLAGSSSTMRAAAATAVASGKAPSTPPAVAARSAGKPPGPPAKASYSARPRSGSLEAAQSVTRASQRQEPAGLTLSPEAGRPPMVRRGSSQNSLSKSAAAQAIQPRRRESVDSAHSSSSAASRTVKPDDGSYNARSEVPLSPSAVRPNSMSGLKAAPNTAIRASLSSPTSTVNTSPRKPRPSSQFGGVPAPETHPRSGTASAAARASIAAPIQVDPREPLSSKFVSSLTQALKREMNERQELQNAKNNADECRVKEVEKTMERIAKLERVKSTASDGSSNSGVGPAAPNLKSSVPLQAARSSGSGNSRSTQQPSEADIAEREKKKANALSAALAAGGKAESEMARIHMQVNLAVQDALQTASRRELMKRYRPSSHWSAPVKPRRPQLQRIATSDSTSSAQNGLNLSLLPNTGPNPATIKPWQVAPEGEDSGDSEPSTPVTPSSSVQSFGSVPMHSQYGDNVAASSSVPSLVQAKKPPASPSPSSSSVPKSSEISRWKSWTQNVLSRQRAGAKSNKADSNGSSHYKSTAISPMPTVLHGPSATYVAPGLAGQPPVFRQEPMVHTLRGRTMRGKRFNEDKPWKNHQDLYYLSETERKRYEKLWAANRCTHLPFLFLNPEYEGLWHAAVARRFPQLYKKESNSDQASTKTSDSAASHPMSSPVRSCKDRDDAHGITPHRTISFNSTYSSDHPLKSPLGGASGSAPGSPHSLYGTSEDIKVESLEQIIDASYGSDREISPESIVGNRELVPLEEESPKDYLDDLQSVASSIEKDVDKQSEDIHGYVVSRLWRRSRLPEEILAEIWELVDTNKDGTLDRSSFVVGMWLCDQCLYGRKLPARVPYEVWQSVGKLHLKVRFKEPKSKTWYMSRLPNFMGSAVGHTMHGGRQAVKKVVQTATS